jgi:hypothetical protein
MTSGTLVKYFTMFVFTNYQLCCYVYVCIYYIFVNVPVELIQYCSNLVKPIIICKVRMFMKLHIFFY